MIQKKHKPAEDFKIFSVGTFQGWDANAKKSFSLMPTKDGIGNVDSDLMKTEVDTAWNWGVLR